MWIFAYHYGVKYVTLNWRKEFISEEIGNMYAMTLKGGISEMLLREIKSLLNGDI